MTTAAEKRTEKAVPVWEEGTPIEKQQLYEDEPNHAEATFVESTGDYDEYLFLTSESGEDAPGIPLSPMEARRLVTVINRWLERVPEDDAELVTPKGLGE